MTRFAQRYGAWLIILTSFLVPALLYATIPDNVLMTRGIFGGSDLYAERSLFTVFRVPLIDTVSALVFLIISRASVKEELKAPFARFCTALIFTAAFKSLFQSLETVSGPAAATVFFYLTAAVVLAGLASAVVLGRVFLSSIRGSEFRLGKRESSGLFVLLLAYLGLAILPILYYDRT